MRPSKTLDGFDQIYAIDFEYCGPDGNPPEPICMVVKELRSGVENRYWRDDLKVMAEFPQVHGRQSLFVAYYASAEMNCFLTLGWSMPANVLDLFSEFRLNTNGLKHGAKLIDALSCYGIDSISYAEKDDMRKLALRGGPWTESEKTQLMDYCASDVYGLEKLLPAMLDQIDLSRALIRGDYVKAVANIEHRGIPVDVEALARLRKHWSQIQDRLIEQFASKYDIYEGRSFRTDKFATWLERNQISWPIGPQGKLDLKKQTFRDMAQIYPIVAPLHELRVTLSLLRLKELPVGTDGRNRTMLSYLRSKTGRNQPSNSRFMFGPSKWIRSLIKPSPGNALAYIDWSQQEFGIAAALSGDRNMKEAYLSGDPYLAFAIQAGAAPKGATKVSHKEVRKQFKECALGVQYGMTAESLAHRIKGSSFEASNLLRLHRETYSTFWQWSEAVSNFAMAYGNLTTVFGWRLSIGDEPNNRSIRNFPMQANGAEMLRIACAEAIERGIEICAPVHDAILIEAPADSIAEHAREMQEVMAWASEIVLDGFTLFSDAHIVRDGERYFDEDGVEMWHRIMGIVDELGSEQKCAGGGYQ